MVSPFRKMVLVCGGRTWGVCQDNNDIEAIALAGRQRKAIETDLTLLGEGFDTELTVIEGGAAGADTVAGQWARRRRASGVANVQFKADWKTHGRAAGPIRNQEMLDWLLAAEAEQKLVLAYPGGRGTADMVTRAREAGVAVRLCEPGVDSPPEREQEALVATAPKPEADVPSLLRGTISFSRKLNDGDFGGTEVMHAVQYEVDPNAPAVTTDNAKAAVLLAKSVVFAELGIEADFNDDGVLVEKPRPKVERASKSSNAQGPSTGRPQVRKQDGELPEWFDTQVQAAREKTGRPIVAVWDNRKDVAGTRRPHFKEVDGGRDAAGIWPPKES